MRELGDCYKVTGDYAMNSNIFDRGIDDLHLCHGTVLDNITDYGIKNQSGEITIDMVEDYEEQVRF